MDVWFTSKRLSKRTFSGSIADISKSAKCSGIYTPHCLERQPLPLWALLASTPDKRSPLRVFFKFLQQNIFQWTKNNWLVNACPLSLLRTLNRKTTVSNSVTWQEQKKAIGPLQTCAEMLISTIRHPSILWDLLNSCQSRCSTTVFFISNYSFVYFTVAMRVFRENQPTSPGIVHSAIFVFIFDLNDVNSYLFDLFFYHKSD